MIAVAVFDGRHGSGGDDGENGDNNKRRTPSKRGDQHGDDRDADE